MNDLELCKKFAELEGKNGDFGVSLKGCFVMKYIDGSQSPYNPITDLALNCAARDKYEIEVKYQKYRATGIAIAVISIDGKWRMRTHPESKEDIPRAVIECILKSEGLL